MKNATPQQLEALRLRAERIARRHEPLEQAVRRIARENRIVGLSLVLCPPDGKDAFVYAGHARLAPRTPVGPDTCFRLASVSKLVMAFGALALAERGLVHLDRDIGAYLGYSVRSPHAPDTPVTLRMLLTHTGGLHDGGTYGTRGMHPGCTLRELLADAQNWLPRRPGEAFTYSNLGAGAAGSVLECATNLPLETIMQRYVFAPLGIRAACGPGAISPPGDLADGYSVRGVLPPRRRYHAAALSASPPAPFDPERDYLIAAGRMITDSRGMAALIRLLASDGTVGGVPILQSASLDMMRAPQDGQHGVVHAGRGLNTAFLPGVFPGYNTVCGHQGVAYGMCAELFADPVRGCGVGVMTSGTRLVRQAPLMRAGFDLLALGFAALED